MTSQLRTRITRLLGAVTGVALTVGLSVVGIAAPAHAATQDGVYVGENSHGYDISITVSGGKVTDVVTSSTAFCGVNPPFPFQVPFNEIPATTIGADGTFQANWTYDIDADTQAEYWLGGTFHADGSVTSSGSNAADMVGAGLLCTGTQFTYEAAIDGIAPQISVSPNPATLSQITDPNGVVRFTGTGFVPGSTVGLFIDGQQATTRTADADGGVEVILYWQNATVGEHSARFTSGARTAETTLTIIDDPTYNPTASVDPTSATVSRLAGAGVAVAGAGFPASVPVEITFDGTSVATVTSGADGSVAYALTRAGVAPGAHTIALTNGQWSASAALTVEADPVVYDPEVTVTPESIAQAALAGTGVQVAGTGFPENAPVEITFDGTSVATVTSGADGSIAYSLTRAGVTPGAHTIALTSGQWSASASLAVTADPVVYDPEVTVTPDSISQSDLAGTGVQVAGTGFPENAPVEVLFDGAVVTTVTSSASGAVATTVARAGIAAGTSTVLLRSGQWEASDTVTVTADPVDPAEVTLSPTEIATGELATDGVSLTAEGLEADTPVRVLFNGAQVAEFTASAGGTGGASFTVADVAPGTYTVQLVEGPGFAPRSGGVIGALAAGDVLGEATLTVTEDPTPGNPQVALGVSRIATDALAKTGVQLTGSGFTPNQPVTVTFDGDRVGEVVADAQGAIAYTLRVSGVAPGAYPVALTQGALSADVTLTVTAASQPGTPGPGTGPGQTDGGGLATTGTDAMLWTGIAAVALALIAAGGFLLVRRRRA
ncbi:LPXTG cell wall anchor domain-containing protein [Microbacterium sp. PMB16]|uniref:LPXTG cell wall anchor domain-containing protein n=1 Tax=Microbacterium sp. PMB16 TaxID=3120157 RepID=UPI003F4B42D9